MENATTSTDILQDFTTDSALEDASTGMRFTNYLIDLVAFYVVTFVLGTLAYWILAVNDIFLAYFEEESTSIGDKLIDRILGLILYAIFYMVVEGFSKGRTLGKLITKTKVVHTEGRPLNFKDYVLRSLSRIVPFEQLSAFSGYPWHDKWTNTRVVKIR